MGVWENGTALLYYSVEWSTRIHLSMTAHNCIVEKVFAQIISQLDFSSAIILNVDYIVRAINCAAHTPSCAAHAISFAA